jgi:hypothetical protein
VDSALSRWAFDLWGIIDGQADLDSGLPATRAWFDSVRAHRTSTQSHTESSREAVISIPRSLPLNVVAEEGVKVESPQRSEENRP